MLGRLLRCGIAISRRFCSALYFDLSEMVRLYVEGHAHLSQNKSDLDGIAMWMRGEHIDMFILISSMGLLLVRQQ